MPKSEKYAVRLCRGGTQPFDNTNQEIENHEKKSPTRFIGPRSSAMSIIRSKESGAEHA
jgi:hypothetical protein